MRRRRGGSARGRVLSRRRARFVAPHVLPPRVIFRPVRLRRRERPVIVERRVIRPLVRTVRTFKQPTRHLTPTPESLRQLVGRGLLKERDRKGVVGLERCKWNKAVRRSNFFASGRGASLRSPRRPRREHAC